MKLIIFNDIEELANKIVCKLRNTEFIDFSMNILRLINPDGKEQITLDKGTKIIEITYKNKYGTRK